MGLTAFARRHPFELSQGEKRRLALAALTVDEGRWPLLVLDEPLAGLDARGAAGLVRRIEAMTLQGKAIALITHDMDLALRLCPRSIVLDEGRIVAEGATQTLLEDRDLLRRAGLTEPAIGGEALAAERRRVLKSLHPIGKLAVCLVWLFASVLIFDVGFQAACIAVPCLALMALNRTSPLTLLAVSVPFSCSEPASSRRSCCFAARARTRSGRARSVFATGAGSAGTTLVLRAVACGMISFFFASTTDAGALVRALLAAGWVRPRVAYALFAALQLAPDLAMQAHELRMARAVVAGRRPRRLVGPFEAASLVIPLLAFAIRRAGRVAIAMEARGLSPDGPRTIMNAPRPRGRDAVFVLAALATLLVLGRHATMG